MVYVCRSQSCWRFELKDERMPSSSADSRLEEILPLPTSLGSAPLMGWALLRKWDSWKPVATTFRGKAGHTSLSSSISHLDRGLFLARTGQFSSFYGAVNRESAKCTGRPFWPFRRKASSLVRADPERREEGSPPVKKGSKKRKRVWIRWVSFLIPYRRLLQAMRQDLIVRRHSIKWASAKSGGWLAKEGPELGQSKPNAI